MTCLEVISQNNIKQLSNFGFLEDLDNRERGVIKYFIGLDKENFRLLNDSSL